MIIDYDIDIDDMIYITESYMKIANGHSHSIGGRECTVSVFHVES